MDSVLSLLRLIALHSSDSSREISCWILNEEEVTAFRGEVVPEFMHDGDKVHRTAEHHPPENNTYACAAKPCSTANRQRS